VLRRLELEGVAGQFQGRHFLYRDPQQPREGARLDLHVLAPGYRDAEGAARVPEGVALQEHAVALRDLEVRVGRADVLEGLPLGDHAVDPRDVHSLQGRASAERTRLYPQLAAVGDLEVRRFRRNGSLEQLHVLRKETARTDKHKVRQHFQEGQAVASSLRRLRFHAIEDSRQYRMIDTGSKAVRFSIEVYILVA